MRREKAQTTRAYKKITERIFLSHCKAKSVITSRQWVNEWMNEQILLNVTLLLLLLLLCQRDDNNTYISLDSQFSLFFYYIWFASHWFAGASQSSQNRNRTEFSVCLCVCPLGQKMCLRLFAFIAPFFFFFFFFWVYSHRENIPYFLLQTSTVGSFSHFIYPSLNFSRTLYRWPFSFWLAELLLLLKKRSSGFL